MNPGDYNLSNAQAALLKEHRTLLCAYFQALGQPAAAPVAALLHMTTEQIRLALDMLGLDCRVLDQEHDMRG